MSSPDVANAISTYKKARNRRELAQRTLDRSKDLLDHRAIAQKDLEAAEPDFNDAATDVENSLQALKIFGVTQQEIDQARAPGCRPSTRNWRCARRSPAWSCRNWSRRVW